MVARLLPTARAGIDARSYEAFHGGLVEQQMVDTNAGVALERLAPISPEAVYALLGMKVADRVGPTMIEVVLVGGLGVGCEQRVILPVRGLVYVEVSRNDVIVAAGDDWCFQIEQRFEMSTEAPSI